MPLPLGVKLVTVSLVMHYGTCSFATVNITAGQVVFYEGQQQQPLYISHSIFFLLRETLDLL